MNFYTDPDPGLGNSPYGSKEKKFLFQFFHNICRYNFSKKNNFKFLVPCHTALQSTVPIFMLILNLRKKRN